MNGKESQVDINKNDIQWLKDSHGELKSWLKSIGLLLLGQLLGGLFGFLYLILNVFGNH